jgi:hypothetical protein
VITQHLPARPIGSGDPIFNRADSTVLKPAECDFRAHDTNVTTRLNLLACQPTRFNVDLDCEKSHDDTHPPHALEGVCKQLTRRWMNVMASWRELI